MLYGAKATNVDNFPQIVVRVCPDDLYCNILTRVFSLPHIRISTPVKWIAGLFNADGDLQGSRKKCILAAYPVQ